MLIFKKVQKLLKIHNKVKSVKLLCHLRGHQCGNKAKLKHQSLNL